MKEFSYQKRAEAVVTTGGHFVCACVTVSLRVQIWRWSVLCLHFFSQLAFEFLSGNMGNFNCFEIRTYLLWL